VGLATIVAALLHASVATEIGVVGLLVLLSALVVELHRKSRLQHAETLLHVDENVRETTAATQLVSLIGTDAPLPAMGGWAMEASALLTMFHLVRRHRPAMVLELGSGASTVVLGHAVRGYGGRLVSLDHDAAFAEATRAAVADHGLADVCTVRVAPLVDIPFGDGSARWYDPSALADLDSVGLLVVDGPPGASGPRARQPALHLLRDRLAPGAFVILDDVNRDDERGILLSWDRAFPELEPVRSNAPRVGIRRVPAGHN